jgi:type III secretory pathway component EscS
MNRSSQQKIDWASWSTRRLITVAVLYGLGLGCVIGIAQALVDNKTLGHAIELVALNVTVWWIVAALALLGIRWLARHPRR